MERSTPMPKQFGPVTNHEQPRREPPPASRVPGPRRSLRVETLEERVAPTVLWADRLRG